MMYGKWLVECLDENGEWNKFNYFTCDLSEVKEKWLIFWLGQSIKE